MNPPRDLLPAAQQLARRLLDQAADHPILPTDLAGLVENTRPAQRAETISALVQQAQESLDRAPRQALSLAQVAHELARANGEARQQAIAALTFAIALNRLGEFREARRVADEAVTLFNLQGDTAQVARALCESAWADTFIGDLNLAIPKVNRVRAMDPSPPQQQARCHWVEARVYLDQTHYPKAVERLKKACELLRMADLPLDAARCESELAYGYILSNRGEVFPILEQVRHVFELAGCVLDATVCDYLRAAHLSGMNRYDESLELALSTRHKFTNLRAGFFIAWCNLTLGVNFRHLRRYDESLQASQQARDYFLSHGIRTLGSACDINLGSTYYLLNRYDEALAHYQKAAVPALAEGREARVARLYINMGLIYAKQGLFSKALDLYYRTLRIAMSKDLPLLAAGCHKSLAACYRELGQTTEARHHLNNALDLTRPYPHREALIQCQIDLAEIHLALGENPNAVACLEQARSMAAEDKLDSLVAVCDRLLAQATAESTSQAQALKRVDNARTLFLKHTQIVDAALCDLTEGELHLQFKEIALARECFQRAHRVLSPAFPDQAWRANYGLGRCALVSDQRTTALEHYLRAVHTIAIARAALVTEQLSNDFFSHRQSIYDEALSLALQLGAHEAALEIIEARKARTFLTLLQQHGWKTDRAHQDPYITDLIEREKQLCYQLNTLRGRLTVQTPKDVGETFRSGAELDSISTAALDELNALNRSYEAVATQLRLAMTGLAGVASPLPFSLEKFRAAASDHWGSDWVALDYCLSDGSLTIVVVYPDRLEITNKSLSPFDRAVLEKCTRTEPDLRELVYRGTLRGEPVPFSGPKYLQHLYHLLIPRDLTAGTLIISPHGLLHTLPFQALMENQCFLIERHTLLYTPNLQGLEHLLRQPSTPTVSTPLIVGVSQFGERANTLPFVSAEVDQLDQIFDGRGQSLRENEATRQRLLDLNASGELEKFDLVHFATHAVLDPSAPHQSRVLLHDDSLTAMDVLDLSLNARLITLSACQTMGGKGGHGDEWLGLARAFFYAGTQALLATLWPVEDKTVVALTERFYRHWTSGKDAATSLREAELDMLRAGYPPYQWAPFVLMGRP